MTKETKKITWLGNIKIIVIIIIIIFLLLEIMMGSKLFILLKSMNCFQKTHVDHMKHLLTIMN